MPVPMFQSVFSPYCSTTYQTLSLQSMLILCANKHYYSSYIVKGRCSWSHILIVYLVIIVKLCFVNDLTGCEIMCNCMTTILTHCPFKE